MSPKTIKSVALPILMTLAILSAAPALAQDTPATEAQTPPAPPPPPPAPQRPVRPPMANTPEMALDSKVAIVPLPSLDFPVLGSFATPLGVSVYPDASGDNVILVGPEEAITKVQEFISLFNTPPDPDKNVLLTFYVVATRPYSQNTNPQVSPAIQEELSKLLASSLGTSQFFLWDALYLRVRDNNTAQLSGFLPTPGQSPETAAWPTSFQIQIDNVAVATVGEELACIALDNLMCGVELGVSANTGPANQPRPVARQSVGFKSNLNIKEGQPEIVSKISISSDGDSVIIIVSAQVLKD